MVGQPGRQVAFYVNKNILTISKNQPAEAYKELSGTASKRLKDYRSRIWKESSCFGREVGLDDFKDSSNPKGYDFLNVLALLTTLVLQVHEY